MYSLDALRLLIRSLWSILIMSAILASTSTRVFSQIVFQPTTGSGSSGLTIGTTTISGGVTNAMLTVDAGGLLRQNTIPGGNSQGGYYFTSSANFSGLLSPSLPTNLSVNLWSKGTGDTDVYTVLQSGTTTETRNYLAFLGKDSNYRWLFGKNGTASGSGNNLILYDATTGIHRMFMAANSDGVSGGLTYLNSGGNNPIQFNHFVPGIDSVSVGSGGIEVWNGSFASPQKWFSVNALGTNVLTSNTNNIKFNVYSDASGTIPVITTDGVAGITKFNYNGVSGTQGGFVNVSAAGIIPLYLGTSSTSSAQPTLLSFATSTANICTHGVTTYSGVATYDISCTATQAAMGVNQANSQLLLTTTAMILGGGAQQGGGWTPVSFAAQVGSTARAGTDSNVGGGNGTIRSGLGTGTGTPSTLTFQAPAVAASGTGAQTFTTVIILSGAGITASLPITYNIGSPPANSVVCYKAGGVLGYATNTSGVIGTTCN